MIQLLKQGKYSLVETKNNVKVLILDKKHTLAWINAEGIGEILVKSYRQHKLDCVLSKGDYEVYEVEDEDDLTDLIHLELSVGEGEWQGYLLPKGLPDAIRKRHRIIPTEELVNLKN